MCGRWPVTATNHARQSRCSVCKVIRFALKVVLVTGLEKGRSFLDLPATWLQLDEDVTRSKEV